MNDKTVRLPQWIEDAARAACYGLIANWIALWVTERPAAGSPDFAATAGFPFRAMLYPHPPMGGDYVPVEMWVNFVANWAFWACIALLLMHVPLLARPLHRHRLKVVALLTAGVTVAGALFLLLKFD